MATPAAVLSIIVEANTGKAEAALKEFQRNLSKADREKAEAELAFQVEKGGYNVFSGLVKKADSMSAEASLGFEVDNASLVKAKAAQAVLTKESSKLSDVFSRSQLSIGQWTGILAASLPVVFDLAGALGALTASLGAATAGLGALAVGGGAAGIVGIAGIASVAAPAIASLGDLKTAQDAYTEAVERYGKESSQAETAMTKLAFEQKRAGPLATALSENLRTLTSRWKELTKAGQTDFIGMLNDGITRLNRKLPMLAESANKSMKALRVGFDRFLDRATGPEFNHFIEVMTNTFAKSVKPLAGAFGNIAKVLQRIAVAVAPDIVRMARAFEEMTEGWVDSTRNARNLRETIHGLVGQTKAWWELLVAAKDLIVAVLVPGMGEGKKAIQEMTGQLKEWTNWANSHPKEIRDFMKEGLKTTKLLAQVLISFLPQLFEIAKATRPIARAFLAITRALNSIKVGNVSVLTGLIGAFVAARFIRGMMAMRATLGLLASGAVARGAAAVRGAAGATAATTVAQAPFGAPMPGPVGAGKAGGTWGQRFGTAARGAMLPIFSGLGVAVAGSFAAQPLLKKFHEIAKKAADDFPKPFGGVGDAIADLAIPDHILPEIPEHPGGILGLLGVGKDAVDKLDELAEGVRGGKQALTGLEKVLDGFSSMTAQEAIDGLRKKYGGLVTAGHEMSKKQREAFVNMARAARENGDITQNQLEQLTNAFDNNSSKWERSMRRAADATGQSTKSIKRTVGDMKVKVSKDYEGMVRVSVGAIDWLTSDTSRALVALGVKDQLHFRAVQKTGAIDPHARQRGGHIPGAGEGDKVPAMLEPGEFVVNKKATKAARPMLEDLNFRKAPRFAKGGEVKGGGMQAMISEANKFEARHFPYAWGGGHGGFGIQPVDCSGAVSDVLHAAGLLNAPMTSGALMNWGKPGKGPLTVYTNPHHVVMSLNGKVFGTSGSNPGDGAGWIEGASGESLAPGAVRTMDVAGAVADKIKRVILKGPDGPLKDMGQASLDKVHTAANRFIALKMPGGAFGGGQALAEGALSKGQIAKVWKRANRGQGDPSLMAAIALAESSGNPQAVGDDPGGTQGLGLWQITTGFNDDLIRKYGGRSGMFNAFNNAQAAGDLLARQGLGAWVVYTSGAYRRFLKQGGMVDRTGVKHQALVAPYVGSFDKGGEVAQTGLGMLHKGEHVVALKEGGFLAGGGGSRPPASGGSGGTRADDRGSRGLGIERIKQIRQRLGKQLSKALPVLDERIDIAERLAGLTSSPAGSELSKGELREQMSLQQKLLDNLRKTLQIAKRGADLAKRTIERLEKHVKKLERKIKVEQRQMEQKVKRLTKFIKDEEGKNKPDREKIAAARERINEVKERHGKPIAKWTEEARKKAQGATKLKPMLPAFRDAIVEMSGLTGRSGRIFDTKLSIKELRDAGKPQPLHIAELLEFAEAMRFGAFRRAAGPDSPAAPLPTFHQGGIVPGPRGQEVQVMAKGGEVFLGAGQNAVRPVINLEARVFVGDREITDIVRTEISEKDRGGRRVHRAGRRP